MADWLIGHAGTAYAIAFVGGFVLVAAWETLRPLRPASAPTRPRWIANIGLVVINQTLFQILLPVVGIGAAWYAQQHDIGLFPTIGMPAAVSFVIGLITLDLLRWIIHVAMHRMPLLWLLHRVHHSDLDYDCTIGLRFHPIEALLTQAMLVVFIITLGLSPLTVLVSDVLSIALGYVVHGNVSLPPRWDRWVRKLCVTPDLHRVHHSVRVEESQSNFGSVFSCWDRLFGTYRNEPADGQLGMSVGLDDLRDPGKLGLVRLLCLPVITLSDTVKRALSPEAVQRGPD